jgi:hypothetical protein
LNRWSWLAIGAGAYVAFTLSQFPAGTAYSWFAPAGVSFTGIEGTLWSGRAAAGSAGGLELHDVEWRVKPLYFFLGRLAAHVKARLTDGFVEADVAASPSRVSLSGVTASTSIPALRSVLPVSGVRGLANVRLSKLDVEAGAVTAIVGELRLGQLEVAPFIPSASRDLLPIGDYAVEFQEGEREGVDARFRDTGGPLEVTGTLVLDRERAYTLDGLIKPRPDASPQLVQGLEVITADPDPEGRRRITLTGSL